MTTLPTSFLHRGFGLRRGRRNLRARLVGLVALAASLAGLARAQTTLESSVEARFQLDFQVPEAALKPFLPQGWTLAVASQGPAKDANLRVIFVDRLTVNAPDGQPVGAKGSNRLVYLAAPVRDAAGASAQLVIGGITEDPADVSGFSSVYLPASRQRMERKVTNESGSLVETQDWSFAAASGEQLEMHVKFVRGSGMRRPASETKFYSAKMPGTPQISRQEQVLDILRNVTTNPADRVLEFSFRGSGGSFSPIFDGTEKVLSWDNIVWINRTVLLPAAPDTMPGLKVGDKAADFTLMNAAGQEVALQNLLKKGKVAVVFVRSADWCPFCRRQLQDLQKDLNAIEGTGVQLVAISYDAPATNAAAAAKLGLTFPLLSDTGSKVIDAYGIRNREATGRGVGIPHPVVFILDQQGMIRVKLMRDNYRERPESAEIIAGVKSFN